MKKVLIWNDYPLGPVGGPSGYLYNLRNYILENNIKNIEFLNNEDFIKKKENKKRKKFHRLRILIKTVKERIFKLRKIEKHINKIYKPYEGDYSFINNYDVIHFHDVKSFNRAEKILKEFKGITILTSHCPKTPAEEEIEDNLKMNYDKFPKRLKESLERYDQNAFEKVNYVVFPCKDAQEPYEENSKIKEILLKREKRKEILYIPTGIPLKELRKDSEFFPKKNIDIKNKFVVSYIGRHNKVKGYDFLKRLGERVLAKYNDVIFIIGGEISEEIPPLKNEAWIEFGWTKEGYEIIKNSDIFILPNEKTYFDLILLEVLSMGIPLLLTNTGGNKYFKKFNEKGFLYFEQGDLNEALKRFDEAYNLWKLGELKLKGIENYELFLREFTVKTFGDRYKKLYSEVKE